MYVFGSGVLIGQAANGSPINFGLVQEVTMDISTNTKSLYGQNNFPVAIGSGTRKMSGKAKLARISGTALGQLFFGFTPAVGQNLTSFGEAASVPASTPYTKTVTNSATFVQDLGVVYATTGLPLKQVTSGPTVGQYSVSAGVYTFAAADAGAAVLISYRYTNSTTGEKFTVTSQLIGPTVNFSANLYATDPTTGGQFNLYLYSCVAEKLSFGTKLEDFMMPEMDFQCFANAAGQVCDLSLADAS
jgi:hypothetical protein